MQNEAEPPNISIETPLGLRLSKQKPSRKIDGSVALSFAVLAAVQTRRLPTPTGTLLQDPSWEPERPIIVIAAQNDSGE